MPKRPPLPSENRPPTSWPEPPGLRPKISGSNGCSHTSMRACTCPNVDAASTAPTAMRSRPMTTQLTRSVAM
ncbi:Uncharacterised protein [Mycobacteroides abscessus]|nr:Uncharacterised protein [Mycobacteroides abscessus]